MPETSNINLTTRLGAARSYLRRNSQADALCAIALRDAQRLTVLMSTTVTVQDVKDRILDVMCMTSNVDAMRNLIKAFNHPELSSN